jgi:hypothetical protein
MTHSSGCRAAASERRPRTASPTRNGLGACPALEPEGDAERVTLTVWEVLDQLEDRRTELLQCRVVEFHLSLDARRPDDAKIVVLLDRVLEQRGLADAGDSEHHDDGAVTVSRGIQQPLEHRALAMPPEQPPRLAP